MLLVEFFSTSEGDSYANLTSAPKIAEDSWSGPDNAWHNQGEGDQWYDGNDQWHGQASGNMAEDFSVANIVTTEDTELSDILTARELVGAATRDPQNQKHKYFEFLKYIRQKHGSEYSTRVHQKAAELARQKA